MAASARRAKAGLDQEPPFYVKSSPMLLAETTPSPRESKPSPEQVKEWAVLYQHCESRIQALWNWRLAHWTTWGQIARYQAPWRYYAFVQSPNLFNQGLRNDFAIVDRTATLAGEICAAGLMAGLTDPDSRWLKLGPAIPGIELDQAGEQYYEDWTERLNYVYDHSNFYDAQNQHYQDLTFFGTAPVLDYESEKKILQVRTPCAGEYFLGVGGDFDHDVFAEEIRQTVDQTVDMFGIDNCPPDVQQQWRQKGGALQQENIIGHLIEPNFAIEGDAGYVLPPVPGGFTWREVYWMRQKKDIAPLSVSGFHERPFSASLWDRQGNDPYGRGVGEKMLADTIQLQLETRQKAESIEKVNKPPMGADVSLLNQPASTNPGKITYMNTANGGEKKFWSLYEIKPDIPAISKDIELVQNRIRETAYNKAFAVISNLRDSMKGQVTATEIDALKEEALMQLGPVTGRVHSTLRTRIRRHMAMMRRLGLAPRVPASLRGVPLKIDLISMLTQARMANQTGAIARTVQFVGSMVSAWPEARFNVDPTAAAEEFNKGVGGSSKILRTKREVQKMVAMENQQKQAANASALTTQAAQAGAALSKTSLAPGNALSALTGAQQ
jgi:hypothetical protein